MSHLAERLREVRQEVEALISFRVDTGPALFQEQPLLYRHAVLAILDRHIAALDARSVAPSILDLEREALDDLNVLASEPQP